MDDPVLRDLQGVFVPVGQFFQAVDFQNLQLGPVFQGQLVPVRVEQVQGGKIEKLHIAAGRVERARYIKIRTGDCA